jgi:hypothetical protein
VEKKNILPALVQNHHHSNLPHTVYACNLLLFKSVFGQKRRKRKCACMHEISQIYLGLFCKKSSYGDCFFPTEHSSFQRCPESLNTPHIRWVPSLYLTYTQKKGRKTKRTHLMHEIGSLDTKHLRAYRLDGDEGARDGECECEMQNEMHKKCGILIVGLCIVNL